MFGEDRHFCIRAAALGLSLYVDTHYPAYHIYSGRIDFFRCLFRIFSRRSDDGRGQRICEKYEAARPLCPWWTQRSGWNWRLQHLSSCLRRRETDRRRILGRLGMFRVSWGRGGKVPHGTGQDLSPSVQGLSSGKKGGAGPLCRMSSKELNNEDWKLNIFKNSSAIQLSVSDFKAIRLIFNIQY